MFSFKKNIIQIQCQIKSFKIQSKIFVILISLFFVSCDFENNKKNNVLKKTYDVKFDRFEKKFFQSNDDSLDILIENYPYLFPRQYQISDWIAIKKDSTRKKIFKKSLDVFKDIESIESEIERIFNKTKFYFSEFIPPKIISINNGIDYKYKIVDSDSLILLSLDCYLGDYLLYKNIPNHISSQMKPDFIKNDLTELISSRYVGVPIDRKFVSKLIYHGKIIYLMNLISDIPVNQFLGYNKKQTKWIENNEKNVWKYFIENDLLFSTKSSLDYRFLANAPFSKFGLSIDYESPPMVGKWIGYQIVKSFAKNKNIFEILSMDNYKLYLNSNYKPIK
mgnify:CR=1 FL=1